jgi:hypothetical protein
MLNTMKRVHSRECCVLLRIKKYTSIFATPNKKKKKEGRRKS